MIEVNALKNSKGEIFNYVIYSWIAGAFSLMIRYYASTIDPYPTYVTDTNAWWWVSATLASVAGFFLFRFIYYFAKACGSLGSFIANCALIWAYSSLGQLLFPFVKLMEMNVIKMIFYIVIIVSGLLQFICFTILAFRFKRNYDGLLGKVGKQLLYIFYATMIWIGILVVSLLSISDLSSIIKSGYSTLLFLVVITIAFLIFFLIFYVKVLLTINKLMVNGYQQWFNNIDNEIDENIGERIVVISEPVAESVKPTFSERRKSKDTNHTHVNKRFWIFGSVGLLVIAGIVVALTIRGSNNDFNGLMTEVNPPLIDPKNLAYTTNIELMGWCPVEIEMEGMKLKTVNELRVEIEFEKWNANEYQIPFKISIYDETSRGEDKILGRGFLMDGNLIAYESSDYYDDNDNLRSSNGRIIMEAKDIKNLAQFNGKVCLYEGFETLDYNFVDLLSWYKAISHSTTSVYEGTDGREAYIQLIKPFGKNVKGVDALAFCISFSAPYTTGYDYSNNDDYGYNTHGGWVLTAIDSHNYMLLKQYPRPYLGVAKWDNERLLLINDGEETEMYLVDRHEGNDNAELLESIYEMEGGD